MEELQSYLKEHSDSETQDSDIQESHLEHGDKNNGKHTEEQDEDYEEILSTPKDDPFHSVLTSNLDLQEYKKRMKRYTKDRTLINTLINELEVDYKSNLSLHLYSSFLMKFNNRSLIPRDSWDSWPLPFSSKLDPKSLSTYYIEDTFEGLVLPEKSPSDFDILELNRLIAEHDSDDKPSSPESVLKFELYAAYQRQVYAKIHKLKHKPSAEFKIDVHLIEGLIDRIDEFLQQYTVNCDFSRVANWTDVLAYAPVSNTLEVNHQSVYKKCENLFSTECLKYYSPRYQCSIDTFLTPSVQFKDHRKFLAAKMVELSRKRVQHSKSTVLTNDKIVDNYTRYSSRLKRKQSSQQKSLLKNEKKRRIRKNQKVEETSSIINTETTAPLSSSLSTSNT